MHTKLFVVIKNHKLSRRIMLHYFVFQYVLILCNSIGTPLDSKYIDIGEFLQVTNNNLVMKLICGFFLWISGSINQAPCSHIQWAYRSVLKQWVEQSSNSPKGWCVASSQCERSHPVYREMATGGLPPAVHNRIFHGPTASYSKYTVGTSCFHISQIFSILSLLLSLIFGEKFRLRHFQSPQISKCWRFEGVSEVPPW